MSDDNPAPGAFDWRKLARQIAEAHGLTFDDVMSRHRYKRLARARWEIFEALRKREWSLLRIAAKWRMDHTSVLYGLRQRAAMRERGEIQ